METTVNESYGIDDLFFSVNDIYAQFDEGTIDYAEARAILVRCCEAFITKDSNR
jgi:hypothetical protein